MSASTFDQIMAVARAALPAWVPREIFDAYVVANRAVLSSRLAAPVAARDAALAARSRPAAHTPVGWSITPGMVKGQTFHRVKGPHVNLDTFKRLAQAAKDLGGYYVRGFGYSFPEVTQAEAFIARAPSFLAGAALPDPGPAQVAQRRPTNDKLRAAAAKLHADAEARLSQQRLANTPKRAREAASAEADARMQQSVANSMTRVADALAAGTAPHLAGVAARTQVELLRSILRSTLTHAEERDGVRVGVEHIERVKYPYPRPYPDHFLGELAKLKGVRGAAPLAAKFLRLFQITDERSGYLMTDPAMIRDFEALGAAAAKAEPWLAKRIKEQLEKYNRLQRMGLDNLDKLKAALREFLACCYGRPRAEDPIKAAERALVGTNIPGYFPTPAALADEVVALADLRPGMRVLEPSAGSGALAEAILRAEPGVQLDVIERQSSLRDLLRAKGFNLVARDFLEYEEGDYDAIIQNPPFEDNADIAHVRHAYDLLLPGGVLVSIMGKGAMSRAGRVEREFRAFLERIGGEWSDNADGAFLSSSRPTGVATVTVVVRKEP